MGALGYGLLSPVGAGTTMPPVRVLGLDVGSKTIGVALSDELGYAAHPVETLKREGTAADAERVRVMVENRGAVAVVVGLPLELSGKVGPRAKRVRVLIEALRGVLGEAVPVHEWDERFSTAAWDEVRRIIREENPPSPSHRLSTLGATATVVLNWAAELSQ